MVVRPLDSDEVRRRRGDAIGQARRRARRRVWWPAALAILASCCGSAAQVVSFEVEPRTACPGDTVTATWEVVGPARLAVVTGTKQPTEPQIAAGERSVASKQRQPFVVTETTAFVLRAVEANQARDPWRGTKSVDVPTADEPRGVTTSCTGARCSGSFVGHARAGTRVLRISEPRVKRGGVAMSATVCITHDALQDRCLAPGEAITTPLPADGAWTLSTTLPDGSPPAPAPGLSVVFHLGCP